MTRWIILVGGAVLIGIAGSFIDAHSHTPVKRVSPAADQKRIFASGRVEGTSPENELRSRLAGRVEQVLVSEGQVVQAGEVLLRLDEREYAQAIALATAELRLEESQLERLVHGARAEERAEAAAMLQAKQAESERARLLSDRMHQLILTNSVSQHEADDARMRAASTAAEVAAAKARLELLNAPPREEDVRIAQARVDSAKAKLELAKTQWERIELRAPIRGQILKINAKLGELAGPESTEPAIILADTSRPYVRAFVEELDAPLVRPGMPATVTVEGLANHQFRGRLTRVSPQMSRKTLWSGAPSERYDTKVREVWLELECREPLVVGLRVDVTIDPRTSEPAPTAPVANQQVPKNQAPPQPPPAAAARGEATWQDRAVAPVSWAIPANEVPPGRSPMAPLRTSWR